MTQTNQNFKVYRGDNALLTIALTQADGSEFETPLNAVLKWRMALNWHSPEDETLVSKSLGAGLEVVEGGVSVELAADDTDFQPGLYHHELRIFDGDDIAMAMVGTMVIKNAIRESA